MFDLRTVFINTGLDDELSKSIGNKSGLVQVERTVRGKHGTYTRKQWVKASEAKGSDKAAHTKQDPQVAYAKNFTSKFSQGTIVSVETRDGDMVLAQVSKVTTKVSPNKSKGGSRKITGVKLELCDKDGKVIDHIDVMNDDRVVRRVSLQEAQDFNPDKPVFSTFYMKKGDNTSTKYSERQVKEEFKKSSYTTFDSFLRDNYFKSDGWTVTDKFYKDGDGNYIPERQELHNSIVQEIVDSCDLPPAGSKPVCFLYGGGSASGKSSTADQMRNAFSESNGIAVGKVDSDEIKKSMPEFEPFKDQYVKSAALRVHDESSDIANEAIDACIAAGKCFAFDGTMKNLKKYTGIVDKLHKAGYHVVAVGTDIPTDEAIRRSDARAKKSGRDVPHSIIKGSHGGFAATFPEMMKQVDEYYLYDNSQPMGEPPTLICTTDGVQNQTRWDEFVKKGNDYIEAKKAKGGK